MSSWSAPRAPTRARPGDGPCRVLVPAASSVESALEVLENADDEDEEGDW